MAQHSSETVLDEAKSLLVSGKRFMALEDYQAATDVLERSCQLFDSYYGVAKRECADAYLEYGLALVALANEEQGTDKLMKKVDNEDEEDNDEGDDEEEEEQEEEEEEEEMEDENGDTERGEAENQKNQGTKAMEHDAEPDDTTKPTEMETVNGKDLKPNTESNNTSDEKSTEDVKPQAGSSTTGDPPQPGTSSGIQTNGNEDECAENEEATTIEIAWEVLCLAKRLFMTDESYEGRLKLAETLQKIGEISIEWDNNDNAVSILEECLKIRSAILEPEDRLIALTYYHLGLAHSFKSETQQANESFQNAINVIEKRISSLSQDLAKAKEAQDTVAIGAYEKEINELKDLLPDMTMRLDDSKEDGLKTTEAIKRTREEMQKEDEEALKVCSDKSKPVDDISHLVKRKAA